MAAYAQRGVGGTVAAAESGDRGAGSRSPPPGRRRPRPGGSARLAHLDLGELALGEAMDAGAGLGALDEALHLRDADVQRGALPLEVCVLPGQQRRAVV